MAEPHELSQHECERLLRAAPAGRVAVTTPTGPHIVAVSYTVVEDAIIVRTSPYSVLGTYGRHASFAFEIDEFDAEQDRGWSVQARGRVEVVTDRDQIATIRSTSDPQPRVPGVRQLYLRLRWSELTGRRIGASWEQQPLNRS